jgi:hypothetical protein
VLLAAAGCDTDAGRVKVKGTVTFDGKPLPKGVIVFAPEGGDGGRVLASVEVVDGQFEMPAKHEPKPGPYKVLINSAQQTGRWVNGLPELKEVLPAKYHEKSTLTADLRPGENVLTFDLKSKE